MVRSRARWVEEAEHPSKYFFNLEKRNFTNKTIKALQLDDDTLTYNPQEILSNAKFFYKKLYSTKMQESPNFEFLESIEAPRLTNDESESIEGQITEFELLKALQSCKNNKTPGSDGLPSEFYRTFWPDIKDHLITSILYSFDENQLACTQRKGILSLLPKNDKNIQKIKNWRPISLLNVDYKIIVKVSAERLKKIIAKLI